MECFALFVLLPVVMMAFEQRRLLLVVLWCATLYALWVLKRRHDFNFKQEWNGGAVTRAALVPLLRRFAVCAVALVLFTLALEPERLFSFPLQRPGFWLIVMVCYPVFSVLPQELVFRSFFFRRYVELFARPLHMAAASALAFSFVHIALENWIAVILSAIGGWFFADTYAKHKSLALVTLEHALYGCFVFTVGLGWYFYSGR